MTYSGAATIATTDVAVPLIANNINTPCFTLTIQAIKAGDASNSAVIYVGGRDVTSAAGLPLEPGSYYTFPPCTVNAYDVKDIYITGTSGDGVMFIYSRF